MSDNFIIIISVASVLGFLSGLGIGGGSLLLLWLTLVLKEDPSTARSINLLFFLPAAAVSCWFRWKQGKLAVRQIYPIAAGGCLGAVLGTITEAWLPVKILRKLFGVVLIATGIREILYRSKKEAL